MNLLNLIVQLIFFLFGSGDNTQSTLHLNESTHYEAIESHEDSISKVLDFTTIHFPYFSDEDTVIHHSGFSLRYAEQHQQAYWVSYYLDASRMVSVAKRSDNFRSDPHIPSLSATIADYKNSGYDRGHLAPAADMSWSEITMSESFYFSNMSPQTPSFNRGIWKKLEEQVRKWVNDSTIIHIATGPILEEGLPYIGPNKVSIPTYYYKAILKQTDTDFEGIAFVLKNESSSKPLTDFIITIDSLEQLTQLNFFHTLPDSIETRVESTVCISCWFGE